jgi:cytochrome oxidase Cu insertion factor (SCO1/SenC/PrrC family)
MQYQRFAIAVLAAFTVIALAQGQQTQPKQKPMQGKLKVGDDAPDFAVKDVEGKETTKLSDLKGKPVVLIFGSCT